jgi:hypothetical protein
MRRASWWPPHRPGQRNHSYTRSPPGNTNSSPALGPHCLAARRAPAIGIVTSRPDLPPGARPSPCGHRMTLPHFVPRPVDTTGRRPAQGSVAAAASDGLPMMVPQRERPVRRFRALLCDARRHHIRRHRFTRGAASGGAVLACSRRSPVLAVPVHQPLPVGRTPTRSLARRARARLGRKRAWAAMTPSGGGHPDPAKPTIVNTCSTRVCSARHDPCSRRPYEPESWSPGRLAGRGGGVHSGMGLDT